MTGGEQEKYEQVLAVPLAFGRDRALFRLPARLHRVPFRVSAHTGDDH